MSIGEAVLLGLILLQSLALVLAHRQRRTDQRTIAAQRAELDGVNPRIELEVGRRTAELQKSEAQFKQSEAKLRKIFEGCPETISINSLVDGRYIDANLHLASSGYTAAELNRANKSKPVWVDRKQLKEFAGEIVKHDIVRNMEVQFRTKSGTVFPALISGAKIDLDGEPCVVSFVSDISRLKRTQERLIEAKEAALAASRAKSEFLSSMSHEIRTPMNSILGMVDLLGETSLTKEQRKYLGTATRNGNALLTLINGILDLARIESGRFNLERTEFALEDLIEQVAETMAVRAHEKKLELITRIGVETPRSLVGDPLRLRQVLINLVGNAIKFTEQGEVAIAVEAESIEADQVRLRFSVRDTGIGIAREQLEAIFQSFTQGDSSATRKYGGAGLGLTIAARLVELMGGRLAVTSDLGRGSVFEFVAQLEVAVEQPIDTDARLDLAGVHIDGALGKNDAPQPDAIAPPAPAEVAQLRRLRILLVDDSIDNRNLIVAYLKKLPYLIEQAENGEVAFTRFIIGKYDLVLMDMQMPVLDGYGAVRKIREWERTHGQRPTPIAALTASALQEDVQRTIEAGCSSHMSKPIKKSRLLHAIVDLTRSREAAVENDAPAFDSAPPFSGRADYLARTRRDIYAMAAALESGDYHTLSALARKTRSESAGLGLESLGGIGDALKDAAQRRDLAQASRQLRALTDCLDRIEMRTPPDAAPAVSRA